MPKQLDIAAETQRTIGGIESCTGLLEKLAGFLGRLAGSSEQGLDQGSRSAVAAALARLAAVKRTLDAALGTDRRRAAPGAERDGPGHCVLRGFSPAVPIPSVLAFLSSNHRTGTLRVRTADETFSLEIVDGDVVHAFSDRSPPGERLGDILVESGALDLPTLEQFLEKYAASGKMGAALEREELVAMDEMRAALEQQTRRLFHRVFTADDAAFYFYGHANTPPALHIRMKMIQLLLESARTQDEEQAGRVPVSGGRPAAGV